MVEVTGAVLSVVCSTLLLIIWCLNPKWRSLHNFISIHQIIFGTIHLCIMAKDSIVGKNISCEKFCMIVSEYSFMASLCWSMCASLVAYLRLVLLVTGKVMYEKRKAAMFSYGLIIIVKGICVGIVPSTFNLSSEDSEDSIPEDFGITVLSVYIIMSANLFIFFNVIKSVIGVNKNIVRKNGTRAIPILGVATLCDVITSKALIEPFIIYFDFDYYTDLLFNYRLVVHTIIVLFNRTSKEYWKKRIDLMKLRRFKA